MRLILESQEALDLAVTDLKSCGARAIKLLEEVVEQSEVKRQKLSEATKTLESAGFIIARRTDEYEESFIIRPTLAGEEALEALDEERDSVGTEK